MPLRSLRASLVIALAPGLPLAAQHTGHTEGDTVATWRRASAALGAQAVVSGTRLTNAVDGRTLTEGYVSQPTVMAHAGLAGGRVALTGTLNFEGLTLDRGELSGGVYGEGYVDRRHPHTLLHEAVVAVQGAAPGLTGVRLSIAAGKGFAPFGTDDPMMRPFERYPVNHHLAQVLERLVLIGGVAAGRSGEAPFATLEAATFGGDEPTGPWVWPRLSRFGDSWSTRLTIAPVSAVGRAAAPLELSASAAGVRAPENPERGGLDARKWSAAARWASGSPLGIAGGAGTGAYALVEWARTDWRRGGRPVTVPGYRDGSVLAEGGVRRRGLELVARAERTDRLEEERLGDPFRTARPASDVSTLGVTEWRVLTLGIAVPRAAGGGATAARFAPFAEASVLAPRAVVPGAVFDPVSFYGARRLWALTAGVRLGVGATHARMGRYGVAGAQHAASHVATHAARDAHAGHDAHLPTP